MNFAQHLLAAALILPNTTLVAFIIGLGTVLINILPQKYRWSTAALLLVITIPLTLLGFWPNGQWGISDWDYYFSYHTDIRRMIVDYNTLPQWNPYICGGTSAIGDPEFPLFAPTFLLEYLFGIPNGLRLAVFAVTIWGGLGMLLLSQRLALSPTAGLLASLAFSLGSINLLEIVEGHPNVFSASYLPWIFWTWLNAYSVNPKIQVTNNKHSSLLNWSLICGILLALMFFHGGIYMLMYVSIVFIFLVLTLPHRLTSLRVTVIAGLWALGFAAIKLVPVLLWLRQFQDKAYASSASLIFSLHKIFLGRYPHGSENIIPNQGGGWHEYGAYIGLTVLALALVSLTQLRQKYIRLLWLGALLAIFIASAGPVLKPLFDVAPFLPRSNISRFMILAVLPLSLLSGIGLQSLLPKRRWALIPAAIIVAVAAWELTSYAALLSNQAFILNPTPTVSTPPTPIAYTINQHVTRMNGVDHTRAYANAIANYGTMSYCSVLGPEPAVRVVEDPEGSPYLTVAHNRGRAELISWSPHKIQVRVDINEPSDLILNSNYASGWWVTEITDTGSRPSRSANEVSGLLAATQLTPGPHSLAFTYHAPGFAAGATLSLLTLISAVGFLFYAHTKKPAL